MDSVSAEGDAARKFAEEAHASGLALPTAGRLNPATAVAVLAIIIAASLAVGYATNWLNLSHARPNPLAELPGCSAGGVSLSVSTEAGASVALANALPSLDSAFSAATGNCLTVATATSSDAFGGLGTQSVDAVVGPTVPTAATGGNLSATTYAVPLFVAPVVIIANLGGAAATLNLSAAALAGVYLGSVASWAAGAITATNPGLHSALNVTAAYLEGPSAATGIFSAYLAAYNASFATEVGAGANVSWPSGVGVASPGALLSFVGSTPGAIGYEPTDLCGPTSLPVDVVCAAIQASTGFDSPSSASVAAAASVEANSTAGLAGDWANATGVAPTNSTVYPMIETTFAVMYRDLGTAYGSLLSLNESKWLIALFFWIAADTAGTAASLEAGYGAQPLPGGFAITAEEMDLTITYLGNWILLPPTAVLETGEGNEGGETGEF